MVISWEMSGGSPEFDKVHNSETSVSPEPGDKQDVALCVDVCACVSRVCMYMRARHVRNLLCEEQCSVMSRAVWQVTGVCEITVWHARLLSKT